MGLLSGLVGLWSARRAEKREDAAIAAQNAYNDPKAVRARYEAAGINPTLAFNGGAVGLQGAVGGSNFMGSAVADFVQNLSGLMTQGALNKADQKNQAIQRKAKSEQKLTRLALRPTVAGPLELARSKGGDAAALGLKGNTGSNVPVVPYSGLGTRPMTLWGLPPANGSGVAMPDPRLDQGTGSYSAGTYIESIPGTSPAAVREEEFGEIADLEGAANYLLTQPGRKARAGLDRLGVTTPGKDYWKYWSYNIGEAGKRALEGKGPILAKRTPQKTSFWSFYGAQP